MNDHGPRVPAALAFRSLFRTILDDTGLKASTVARELQRERSLMYKWLSGSSIPPSAYGPLLVQVVMKHASPARRLILANDLRAIVKDADLPNELRDTILRGTSADEVLAECLDLSLTPGIADGAPRPPRPSSRSGWSIVIGALFAGLCGGAIWNALNRILGWSYYMGSAGETLQGWRALAWGLITSAPIPVPLLFGRTGRKLTRTLLAAIIFTLASGAASLLFHSIGVRAAVERLGPGYAFQETIIVLVFAFVISTPPHLAALLAASRRLRIGRLVMTLLVPTAAALIAFLATLLVDRPVTEVLQLRGFVVAFAMRIAQFFSLYTALASDA